MVVFVIVVSLPCKYKMEASGGTWWSPLILVYLFTYWVLWCFCLQMFNFFRMFGLEQEPRNFPWYVCRLRVVIAWAWDPWELVPCLIHKLEYRRLRAGQSSINACKIKHQITHDGFEATQSKIGHHISLQKFMSFLCCQVQDLLLSEIQNLVILWTQN